LHVHSDLPQLIPAPRILEPNGDVQVRLPLQVTIDAPPGWAETVADLLFPGTGSRPDASAGEAFITVSQAGAVPSGYSLTTGDDGITITAADHDGLVHAIATLRQLMPDWVFGPAPLPGSAVEIPSVRIEDEPRFGWRGMHLDVCRHFMPLPFLYRFVDLLAAHKLNRFHLHLNDDQGWRFEVKKYPRLTTVGAVRSGTQFHHWDTDDETPVGGFYTQDQLRALNGYAKARGITIVPEIDLPGHARALLAAYPEFGENPPADLPPNFTVFPEVLHLSDETVAMVEDVFSELLEVFDSPWIHIGGDECPSDQWETSARAAALATERGLEGVQQLQPWFTRHLACWLQDRGRTAVGWDEIIDHGPIPGVIVMSWRGDEPGRRALAAGEQVVMSSYMPYYFDGYQSDSPDEPFAQKVKVTWEMVAEFDPLDGVAPEHASNLLGIQGQLWTEFMRTPAHVEYMAFPRMAVLAEAAWRGPLDAEALEPRLRRHLERLDAAGVNYRPLDGAHPWQTGGTGVYARER
jgi:hexosaminidase